MRIKTLLLAILLVFLSMVLVSTKYPDSISELRGKAAIVVKDGNSANLYIIDAKKNTVVELARGVPGWPRPCWLAGGTQLVFGALYHDPKQNLSMGHLWLSQLDSSPPKDLTPDLDLVEVLACPFEGTEIAYFNHRVQGANSLDVMDVKSGSVRSLLQLKPYQTISELAWSKGNKRLAYLSILSGPQRIWQLCAIDRDGTNEDCFAENAQGAQPIWSPNADEIAYLGKGGRKILVYSFKDKSTVELDAPPNAWGMAWSPDGTKITYAAGHPDFALYEGVLKTNKWSVLSGGLPRYPIWSASGMIVFMNQGARNLWEACLFNCGEAVYALEPKSGKSQRISPRYEQIYQLSWSEL